MLFISCISAAIVCAFFSMEVEYMYIGILKKVTKLYYLFYDRGTVDTL